MNNSINYGNFIALFIKNNNDEFSDITANLGDSAPNGNKPHIDIKHNYENITGLKIWLDE